MDSAQEHNTMGSVPSECSVLDFKQCRSFGCSFRAGLESGYCCTACEKSTHVPAEQESVDSAKRSCFEEATDAAADNTSQNVHDSDCSKLDVDVLRTCWCERVRIDPESDIESSCLVAPPGGQSHEPAPVVLFLTGNGHINARSDVLWGGIDLLLRNSSLRERCFILAPLPTTWCGLLRHQGWRPVWSEDAVWALFTEVLRRLGPARVDPSRLYVTGLSLGAAGTWHLAQKFGRHLAAVAPISGASKWPGNSWLPGARAPEQGVFKQLTSVSMRAYQIDIDDRAGNPKKDMQYLCWWNCNYSTRDLNLEGVDPGTTCVVHVHEWQFQETGAQWELWEVEGPLRDWSTWSSWGGDSHCLWQRVYPSLAWELQDFFLKRSVPSERQWSFDAAPHVVPHPDGSRMAPESFEAVQSAEGCGKVEWFDVQSSEAPAAAEGI